MEGRGRGKTMVNDHFQHAYTQMKTREVNITTTTVHVIFSLLDPPLLPPNVSGAAQ